MDTTVDVPVRQLYTVIPPEEYVSPGDIVEDNDQVMLRSISDGMKRDFFLIGDIAHKIILSAEKEGFRVKKLDRSDVYVSMGKVFEAVGHFCDRSGRTVRYYFETSKFFPLDVREEFDMLPFSMFVVARSFKDDWRAVLEYASVNPQKDSEGVRSHFVAAASGEINEAASGSGPGVLGLEEEEVIDSGKAVDVVNALSRLVEAVSGFLKKVRLSEQTTRNAHHIMGEFRTLLIDIADELKSAD